MAVDENFVSITQDKAKSLLEKDLCNCNGTRALGLYRKRFDEFEMYANAYYTRTYRDF